MCTKPIIPAPNRTGFNLSSSASVRVSLEKLSPMGAVGYPNGRFHQPEESVVSLCPSWFASAPSKSTRRLSYQFRLTSFDC